MVQSGDRARQLGAALAVLFLVGVSGAQVGRAQSPVPHRDGQGVVPVYDGYEQNENGTLTLWFGYINRNYEETLDIPVGPDNTFGGVRADRGQPTHFLPRRQKVMFSVTVPEAEARSVKWTLTTRGRAESAVATILPTSVISRRRGTLNSLAGVPPNTPPTAQAKVVTQKAIAGQAVEVEVAATDDGQPKRNAMGAATKPGMTVTWAKYRGPGTVTFERRSERLPDSGKVTAKVTFDEPGEYEVLAIVDDGSMRFGEYCCWTNVSVKVRVPAKP